MRAVRAGNRVEVVRILAAILHCDGRALRLQKRRGVDGFSLPVRQALAGKGDDSMLLIMRPFIYSVT